MELKPRDIVFMILKVQELYIVATFSVEELPENEFQIEKRVTLILSSHDDVAENNELNEASNMEDNLRQTVRERCAPDRYGEWVTFAGEEVVEPTTVSEAMQQEIDSLQDYGVWELTELPEGRKAVGCKWVFKVKHNVDGSIERYKARLVAQGFCQRYGEDYDETFSLVVRLESVRTVIALSVQRGLNLHQMDVTSAFLNGELEDEVYMKQPEGYTAKGLEHQVYKLKKSLYSLKQSSGCWNSVLDEHLTSIGFTQTPSDPCIYVKEENGDTFIICIQVDDIILAGQREHRRKIST